MQKAAATLLLLFFFAQAYSQVITLTGKIIDANDKFVDVANIILLHSIDSAYVDGMKSKRLMKILVEFGLR